MKHGWILVIPQEWFDQATKQNAPVPNRKVIAICHAGSSKGFVKNALC